MAIKRKFTILNIPRSLPEENKISLATKLDLAFGPGGLVKNNDILLEFFNVDPEKDWKNRLYARGIYLGEATGDLIKLGAELALAVQCYGLWNYLSN